MIFSFWKWFPLARVLFFCFFVFLVLHSLICLFLVSIPLSKKTRLIKARRKSHENDNFRQGNHLMWHIDSLEKTLMLGKIEGRWKRGQQWKRWLDGITDSLDMSLGKLRQMVKDHEVWHAAVHVVTKSWTWLSNWTTRKGDLFKMKYFLETWKLWPRKSYGLLRARVPGREDSTA